MSSRSRSAPEARSARWREGALFIDHTTVSARLARRLAEEGEARGLAVVDAPVSGGQAGAEKGALAIMCGGSDDGGRGGASR